MLIFLAAHIKHQSKECHTVRWKRFTLIFLCFRRKLKAEDKIGFITMLWWKIKHTVHLGKTLVHFHTTFVMIFPFVWYLHFDDRNKRNI